MAPAQILALLAENQRLRTLTYTDALTGVGSRHAYRERLQQTQGLSYIAIDVNRFKQINDTHGHAAGDAVLAAIAALIRSETDSIYRTGGDEFVVVLDAPLAAAAEVAGRIQQAIAARPIAGIFCSISVGWGGTEADADAAMYRCKRGDTTAR